MSTNLTSPERETIINADEDSSLVRIWTAQRSVTTSLRRKPASFTEVRSGRYGSTEWAEFTIPFADVNWGALAKRRSSPRPNAATNLPRPSTTVSVDEGAAA